MVDEAQWNAVQQSFPRVKYLDKLRIESWSQRKDNIGISGLTFRFLMSKSYGQYCPKARQGKRNCVVQENTVTWSGV